MKNQAGPLPSEGANYGRGKTNVSGFRVMKRVLLTGASGFIGRQSLALLFAKGYEVHAVSSKNIEDPVSNIYWHVIDLLALEQIEKLMEKVQPTHLLHFAWYTVHGECWSSLENFRWVQASLALLQAFARHGGRRLVMAGTCAEYDWKYGYCSEQNTPLLPATSYGACKHALKTMLDAFTRQTGLSGAWGRIFFLYGPHEHPNRLVSSVIRFILDSRQANCSHGNQVRDYLYVKDAADAFVTLLESDVQGAVNIASGRPVSLKEIVCKIGEKLNREDLIHFGTIPSPSGEPHLLAADVRRLSEELGWHPKYSLDLGLDQTIEWWKKNKSR